MPKVYIKIIDKINGKYEAYVDGVLVGRVRWTQFPGDRDGYYTVSLNGKSTVVKSLPALRMHLATGTLTLL